MHTYFIFFSNPSYNERLFGLGLQAVYSNILGIESVWISVLQLGLT